MAKAFYELLFTDDVRHMQEDQGSAQIYANELSAEAPRKDRLGDDERHFLSMRDGFYQATISENGWPYVQFRVGNKGFLRITDDTTIGYADFRGNGQYISIGNIEANQRLKKSTN